MNFDLTNQFLIAMPTLADPNFAQTVTFVCAHSEDGAMGIVINRPMNIELDEVLSQMQIEGGQPDVRARPVYKGGPVQPDRGFVIHQPMAEWDSTIKVSDAVGVSTSRDILEAISTGSGPSDSLVALGYAGWGAGQLEAEMAQNAWLSGPSNTDILFHAPVDRRWALAAAAMGVDITAVSSDVGHA